MEKRPSIKVLLILLASVLVLSSYAENKMDKPSGRIGSYPYDQVSGKTPEGDESKSGSASEQGEKDDKTSKPGTKCTYDEMCLAPEDYANKRTSFQAFYMGVSNKIPMLFENLMKSSCDMVRIEAGDCPIPLFFQSKKSELQNKFHDIMLGRLVLITGILDFERIKTPGKEDLRMDRVYFFIVEDVQTVYDMSEDFADHTEMIYEEDFDNVEMRRLDIQPFKYVDKKLTMTINIGSIETNVPPHLIRLAGILPEKCFKINPAEPFGIPIIASRKNEYVVDSIVGVKQPPRIVLYGTLRELVNKSRKKHVTDYFFQVISAMPPEEKK